MKSLFLAVGLFLFAILLFSGKGLCFVAGCNTETESHKKTMEQEGFKPRYGVFISIFVRFAAGSLYCIRFL